jgi:hypothetical protein
MLRYKTFHMWEVFNDLDRLNAGWTNIYQSERHDAHGENTLLTIVTNRGG